MLKKIGIFGGTFDPIHRGHMGIAHELTEQLQLDRVHFVPCHYPPHRPAPAVTGQQRLAMIKSAIADQVNFVADDRELLSDSASYSIDTLNSFRQEYGNETALYFFMGMDSLLQFPSWHRWQDFLDFCHIVVAARPGLAPPEEDTIIGQYYVAHQADNAKVLTKTHGYITIMPTTPLDIAANEIRADVKAGAKSNNALPETVWSYIKDNRLYDYTEKTAAHQKMKKLSPYTQSE